MATEQQIKANRRNARKSTGPRTPQGKAVVSRNAVKHGLLSCEVLLPDEEGEALADLSELLRSEFQPKGHFETLLVDRIVGLVWRLRRMGRIEAGMLTWGVYGVRAERARHEAQSYEQTAAETVVQVLQETTVTDKRAHKAAMSEWQRMEAFKKESDAGVLGEAFTQDANEADAFSKLSRYEAAVERSLYRALHELQRLRAAQEGHPVPLPVAVDVTVDGSADQLPVSREG